MRLKISPFRFHYILICLLAVSILTNTGCRRKKKIAEERKRQEQLAQQQRDKQLEIWKLELDDIIRNPAQNMADLEAKERLLADIKSQVESQGIQDSELLNLIKQAELSIARDRDRLKPSVMEDDANDFRDITRLRNQLQDMFDNIANAGSVGLANTRIDRALELFSSNSTPVLIIISQAGSKNDYDRPTTIQKYLHYLKDQEKNPNIIDNIVLDGQGKIRELQLMKK